MDKSWWAAVSAILVLSTLNVSVSAANASRPPDLILAHRAVITVDPQDSVSQAIAIRDGKVLRVGTDAAFLALASSRTRT